MTQQCIAESVAPQMQGQGSWLATDALIQQRSAGTVTDLLRFLVCVILRPWESNGPDNDPSVDFPAYKVLLARESTIGSLPVSLQYSGLKDKTYK